MKNIAIIIPVYKAHKTIRRSLYSIASQLNKSFTVYLSVDGEEVGSYDYLLESFPDIDIKILYSPVNRGAGGARQYALDATQEPFVTFVDSDDIFNTVSALDILYGSFNDDRDILVCTSFWRELEDSSFRLKTVSILTWMHGKMYRRSFLNKYNIRFNTKYTNANEDLGFNTQVHLIADGAKERIKQLNNETVYIQLKNNESLTNKNDGEFKYTVSVEGYVMNKIHAHKHVIEELGIIDDDIKKSIVMSFVHIYMNYYGIYSDNIEYVKRFDKFSKIFFKNMNKYVEDFDKDIVKATELDVLDDNEEFYSQYLEWKNYVLGDI